MNHFTPLVPEITLDEEFEFFRMIAAETDREKLKTIIRDLFAQRKLLGDQVNQMYATEQQRILLLLL